MRNTGSSLHRILDPSARTGIFIEGIRHYVEEAEITCFEKDPATSLLLRHLHPTADVHAEGYERIDSSYEGYFDLAVSNVPFEDIMLFDPAFSTSRDLVSAVRLPNNLFSDYAGTDAGRDLIILQKNSATRPLTERQRNFTETRKLSNGIPVNNIFQTLDRVVQTSAKIDTNSYGQPAMVFHHAGGVAGISEVLRDMLDKDFNEHFSLSLYNEYEPSAEDLRPKRPVHAPEPALRVVSKFLVRTPIVEERFAGAVTSEHSVLMDGRASSPDLFGHTTKMNETDAGIKVKEKRQKRLQHQSAETPTLFSEAESVQPTEATSQVQGFLFNERRAAGVNGPRPVGDLLSEVISELKRKSQYRAATRSAAFFEEETDPFGHASEEEWRKFNEWIIEREAATHAAADGYRLDSETGELFRVEDAVAEEVVEPVMQPQGVSVFSEHDLLPLSHRNGSPWTGRWPTSQHGPKSANATFRNGILRRRKIMELQSLPKRQLSTRLKRQYGSLRMNDA